MKIRINPCKTACVHHTRLVNANVKFSGPFACTPSPSRYRGNAGLANNNFWVTSEVRKGLCKADFRPWGTCRSVCAPESKCIYRSLAFGILPLYRYLLQMVMTLETHTHTYVVFQSVFVFRIEYSTMVNFVTTNVYLYVQRVRDMRYRLIFYLDDLGFKCGSREVMGSLSVHIFKANFKLVIVSVRARSLQFTFFFFSMTTPIFF